jgi:hypothetical protein
MKTAGRQLPPVGKRARIAKEGFMKFRRMVATAGGAAALAGMVVLSGPAAWAQDATPEATAVNAPRPAHIHTGNCNNIGEVVAPLTELTGATGGDRLGQANRAIAAESSFTSVPLTLDAILGADHVINVHLSTEQIDTYIACGEIGGALSPEGSLIIGLRELNDSGFTGIAFLAPGADGASTDVSTFIAATGEEGRGGGAEETDATGATTTDATATAEATTTDDAAATDDATTTDATAPTADATPDMGAGADEDEDEDDITIGTPEANQ